MSLASNPTLKGDEARLWKLIGERTQPGADTKAIDQRIWDLFGEDWAVMVTDLAGFSRHVQAFGIIHFLQVIYEQKTVLSPSSTPVTASSSRSRRTAFSSCSSARVPRSNARSRCSAHVSS